MTKFTAPVTGGSDRLDVELIPIGMQLCTLYGLVHLGTQETNFGPKEQVSLAFEFPQVMRTFYEGQPAKPAASFNAETLSMNEKANLRKKWIEPMHKKMTDDEAGAFDMSSLLGKHYVATIGHSPDGKWANILSITPLTEQSKMMYGLTTLSVPQTNTTQFFHISQGFMSDNFKLLPNSVKEKLKLSPEGVAHLAGGGTFAEGDSNGATHTAGAGTPLRKVIMLPTSPHTYEALKTGGWTDDQIVDGGFGKWDEVVPTPVPLPQTPVTSTVPLPGATPLAGVPAPVVAAIVPAPTPLPITPIGPTCKMIDPAAVLADWITAGWTEQQLVENGKATFQ